jgi:uncharacterized membrane protein
MQVVKLWLIVAAALVVADFVWLGMIMKDFYNHELGDLARRDGGRLSPRWGAAIAVYLLIPTGLLLFVRPMLSPSAGITQALGYGALFGLVLYGVYDLTNVATLDRWTVRMAVVDIAWGALLCGAISIVMCLSERWLAG